MNKIVRDYPVDLLPLDLRDGLPAHGRVEIEIRAVEQKALEPQARPKVKLADLVGSVPNLHGSVEETVQHIRRLRGDD